MTREEILKKLRLNITPIFEQDEIKVGRVYRIDYLDERGSF